MRLGILFYVFLAVGSYLFTGCATTKYIPSHYFLRRNDLDINVKPLPAPSHIETGEGSRGLLESTISLAAQSSRAADLEKVFSHIDANQIRDELKSSLSEKVKEYYNVKKDSRDLRVDIKITSWGWILPTGSFGIRMGSYQLQFSGIVQVFDVNQGAKEIAFTSLGTQEQMSDHLSKEETGRKLHHAIDEFAELIAEFMWKSDAKK